MNAVNALRIRAFLSHLYQLQEMKSSIARKLAAIRAFFKFLARERLIAENPAASVSTPKLEKKLPRIMTEEEMNTFLDRVAEAARSGEPAILRDRAILEMLYASGLRVSELLLHLLGLLHQLLHVRLTAEASATRTQLNPFRRRQA